MNLAESQLADLLRSNPDLAVCDANLTEVEPVSKTVSKQSEHQLQVAIVAECNARAMLRPEYGLLFAIPNGGQRHPAVAAKLKAEGVKAGVLDLFLPVARHGYHGLFIELKVGSNKASQAQRDWMRNLTAEGFLCRVVWDSASEAVGLVEWYLEASK